MCPGYLQANSGRGGVGGSETHPNSAITALRVLVLPRCGGSGVGVERGFSTLPGNLDSKRSPPIDMKWRTFVVFACPAYLSLLPEI